MSVANPNWLSVAGLLYAGIGVLLLATALASQERVAGTSRARSVGALGLFGAIVAATGFFLQSLAQFHVLASGGLVVLLMLALIGLLASYGIFAMGQAPQQAADEPGAVVVATRPAGSENAAEPAAAAPATVKLVSSTG